MIHSEFLSIPLPEFDIAEIMRYAKTKTLEGLPFDECMRELRGLTGKVVYAELDIRRAGDDLDLGFSKTTSKSLAKSLGESEKILVFAATIGLLPDQLIARYSKLSPTKAVLIQAIATERIEALCDAFFFERKAFYEAQGYRLKQRFSPGYGDLSITLQQDILSALNANKLLGISLTESLLMMPSKSVTAISGICRE